MWGHVSLVSVLSHQNALCCGLTPKENESLALQGIQFAWHNLAPYNKRAKKFWFSWNVRLRFTTNLNAPYGLFKITRVLSINHTVSTILHCWYLILLTPNIRHVSKCSSPNSPPNHIFWAHRRLGGLSDLRLLRVSCLLCPFRLVRIGPHTCIVLYILYVFSVSLHFWPLHRNPAKEQVKSSFS